MAKHWDEDNYRAITLAAKRNKVCTAEIQKYIAFGRKDRVREYPIRFQRKEETNER